MAAVACAVPSLAQAQTRAYDVPAGRLDEAIVSFGAQSGLNIGIADARIARRQTKGLQGRYALREALRKLLRGTGATFTFINARTVRIVAAPMKPRAARRLRRPADPPVAPPPTPVEIIVTASKQNILLDRYAGSVDVVNFDPDRNARDSSRGTAAIVARLPLLSSTSLGPGREKLFIRGVADSSFNGPTQATVGQYLGDARLTYNAPDPDLNLYDLERVEVLAGPQGTLYGTGALGGIIRLVPNAPDPGAVAGSVSAGIGITRKGGTSTDAAAMLNLPLARDRLSIRAVGYGVFDAGYIDDPARALANVNRTEMKGARFAVRYQPGNDWVIDAGGVFQDIANRDGQYTLRDAPALTRATALAQPYDNNYRLAQLRVGKTWRDLELVSSTAFAKHNFDAEYDATAPTPGSAPVLFEDGNDIRLLSHETRISGKRAGGEDWIAGIAFVRNKEHRQRLLGDSSDPDTIADLRATVTEAALFGQYAIAMAPRLTATIGGRLTYTRFTGKVRDAVTLDEFEPRRNSVSAIPSLSLAWKPREKAMVFLRYQKGRRAGGLSVGSQAAQRSAQRFDSDTMHMIESGFRLGTPGQDRFAASATLTYSHWSDIQADLIDEAGLPFTINIGSGRIVGLDTNITWMPADAVWLELSAFLNRTSLNKPAPAFLAAEDRELPNVAEEGGRFAITYRAELAGSAALMLDGSVRYVGSSQLGIGPPLDVSQGDYFEVTTGARFDLGAVGISVDVSNLGDVRGNRFAFGNPFGLAARDQITPLRPRSIRIGLDTRF